MPKISFLGCFQIHKDRPHWEGIKQGCKDNGVDAEFIDIRRNKQIVNGDIGIACTRDALSFLGDFNKRLWWHCDYESKLQDAKLNAILLSSPNLEVLSNSNVPIYYLPQGCLRNSFIKTERTKDICFLGNMTRGRDITRTDFLKELAKDFEIDFIEDRPLIKDLRDIYPKYKIALSLNARDDIYSTSNRPYLIQGYSGFCLARENLLMRGMFDKGVVYFKDLEDAKEKIKYYLENYKDRENIRYDGWLEIQEKHLYKHRIKRLLEIIDYV